MSKYDFKKELARNAGYEKEYRDDCISKGIRKKYTQNEVEAIICNALEDFLAGKTDTQHIAEFVEYNYTRNQIKNEVKTELKK